MQIILFTGVWLGSKYTSGAPFIYEVMLALDDPSSKSWFEWKKLWELKVAT